MKTQKMRIVSFDEGCKEELQMLEKAMDVAKQDDHGVIEGLFTVASELAKLRHAIELIHIEGLPK